MNRNRFSAIAIAFAALSAGQAMAAGPAYNGETYPGEPLAQASTLTRAQVLAEVIAAQRAGELAQNGEIPVQAAVQAAGKSRAEVRAELIDARRNGTLVNAYGV